MGTPEQEVTFHYPHVSLPASPTNHPLDLAREGRGAAPGRKDEQEGSQQFGKGFASAIARTSVTCGQTSSSSASMVSSVEAMAESSRESGGVGEITLDRCPPNDDGGRALLGGEA